MSTVAQWSGPAAAAPPSDVTAEMTDIEAHIQQTNDRLLCIQQVFVQRLSEAESFLYLSTLTKNEIISGSQSSRLFKIIWQWSPPLDIKRKLCSNEKWSSFFDSLCSYSERLIGSRIRAFDWYRFR